MLRCNLTRGNNMKKLIIKNEKELSKALENNNLNFDGDVIIYLDVKFSHGIKNIKVKGNLDVRGNLYVGGNLVVGGYLVVRGYLYVRGYLDVRGNLYVGGYLDVRGNLDVGGNLDVEGNLDVRGSHVKCKKLYWSHFSMPRAKKIECKIVLPPCKDRDHWEERLGLDCSGDEVEALKRNTPKLKKLLGKKCWSKTERWMIQSWYDNGVKLIEGEKQ